MSFLYYRLLYVQLRCNKTLSEQSGAVFWTLSFSPGLCGLVSLATLSHETRVSVRRKQRKRGRGAGERENEREAQSVAPIGCHL